MPSNDAISPSGSNNTTGLNAKKFLHQESALDVTGVVEELMKIQERSLREYQRLDKDYHVQISTYTAIGSLADALQTSVDKLNNAFTKNAYQVSSSNDSVTTAQTIGSNLSTSSYAIIVTQLAQNHSMLSNAVTQSDSALNISDTLTMSIGAQNFSINIGATDTLQSIRDHINSSIDNVGVTASILSTTALDGSTAYRLVLTSNQSGSANAMTLTGSAVNQLGLTNQLTAAQDANLSINGFNVVSSSNTIADAIDSLSLQINNLGSAQINITPNNAEVTKNISTAVSQVVDNYNQFITYLDNVKLNNPTRDVTLSIIKNNMQAIVSGTFYNSMSLYSLGISLAPSSTIKTEDGQSFTTTGQLQVDPVLLNTALTNNFSTTQAFFLDPTLGFVTQLDTFIDNLTEVDGMIRQHNDMLNSQIRLVDDEIDRENSHLAVIKKNLTRKYATLDTMLQSLQQTNKFLKQQMDSITTRNRRD